MANEREQERRLDMLEATVQCLAAALDNHVVLGELRELAAESRRTQDIVLAIARQLAGGMTAGELEQTQAEARELVLELQRSRGQLSAAVKAETPSPEGTRT